MATTYQSWPVALTTNLRLYFAANLTVDTKSCSVSASTEYSDRSVLVFQTPNKPVCWYLVQGRCVRGCVREYVVRRDLFKKCRVGFNVLRKGTRLAAAHVPVGLIGEPELVVRLIECEGARGRRNRFPFANLLATNSNKQHQYTRDMYAV